MTGADLAYLALFLPALVCAAIAFVGQFLEK